VIETRELTEQVVHFAGVIGAARTTNRFFSSFTYLFIIYLFYAQNTRQHVVTSELDNKA